MLWDIKQVTQHVLRFSNFFFYLNIYNEFLRVVLSHAFAYGNTGGVKVREYRHRRVSLVIIILHSLQGLLCLCIVSTH